MLFSGHSTLLLKGKHHYQFVSFFFWPCHLTCRISVSQLGIEPRPGALAEEVPSPKHWTTREFHYQFFMDSFNSCP